METNNENREMRFLKSLLIFMLCEVLWCALLYGVWSFTQWDSNPSHWTEGARGAIAYFGIAMGLIISGGVTAVYNGKM